MALGLPKLNRLISSKGVKRMKDPKIMESAVLLNLLSHKFVAWSFIKISTAYKYVGFFV